GIVVLVAHARAVAARRRARVAVRVRTRRAVLRKQVRLHTDPNVRRDCGTHDAWNLGQLAPRRRARVVVRVRARRALRLRRARSGRLLAAEVALVYRAARANRQIARLRAPRLQGGAAGRVPLAVDVTRDLLHHLGRRIAPRRLLALHVDGEFQLALATGQRGPGATTLRDDDRLTGSEHDLVATLRRGARPADPRARRGDGGVSPVLHDIP